MLVTLVTTFTIVTIVTIVTIFAIVAIITIATIVTIITSVTMFTNVTIVTIVVAIHIGFSWTILGSLGLSLVRTRHPSSETSWVLLGSRRALVGLSWALFACFGFLGVLSGFLWFSWVLLGYLIATAHPAGPVI